MSDGDRSTWSRRGIARAAAIAVVALGVGAWAGYTVSHERRRGGGRGEGTLDDRGAPAGPAELALLAPLAPGAALADYRVRSIHAVTDGALRVVCERGRAVARLELTLAGPAALAPATAGPYAIYYTTRDADPADGPRLAAALAAIVGQHLSLPTLPGLIPFNPKH